MQGVLIVPQEIYEISDDNHDKGEKKRRVFDPTRNKDKQPQKDSGTSNPGDKQKWIESLNLGERFQTALYREISIPIAGAALLALGKALSQHYSHNQFGNAEAFSHNLDQAIKTIEQLAVNSLTNQHDKAFPAQEGTSHQSSYSIPSDITTSKITDSYFKWSDQVFTGATISSITAASLGAYWIGSLLYRQIKSRKTIERIDTKINQNQKNTNNLEKAFSQIERKLADTKKPLQNIETNISQIKEDTSKTKQALETTNENFEERRNQLKEIYEFLSRDHSTVPPQKFGAEKTDRAVESGGKGTSASDSSDPQAELPQGNERRGDMGLTDQPLNQPTNFAKATRDFLISAGMFAVYSALMEKGTDYLGGLVTKALGLRNTTGFRQNDQVIERLQQLASTLLTNQHDKASPHREGPSYQIPNSIPFDTTAGKLVETSLKQADFFFTGMNKSTVIMGCLVAAVVGCHIYTMIKDRRDLRKSEKKIDVINQQTKNLLDRATESKNAFDKTQKSLKWIEKTTDDIKADAKTNKKESKEIQKRSKDVKEMIHGMYSIFQERKTSRDTSSTRTALPM